MREGAYLRFCPRNRQRIEHILPQNRSVAKNTRCIKLKSTEHPGFAPHTSCPRLAGWRQATEATLVRRRSGLASIDKERTKTLAACRIRLRACRGRVVCPDSKS